MKTSSTHTRCPGPLNPNSRASAEWTSSAPPIILTEAAHRPPGQFTHDEWALLLLCDGTRPPSQLLEAPAAKKLTLTPSSLKRLLQRAKAAGLFVPHASSPPPLPPAPKPVDPASLSIWTLPEARYQCERCGESCSAGYDVGPLPATTQLPDACITRLPTPHGLAPHLPHLDGRCTQLDLQTGLCTLHATFGASSKPEACRHFPLLLLQTPEGTRAALQWECTRLHRQLEVGTPLATQLEPDLPVEHLPECVEVGDGRLVSFERYRILEQFLLDACLKHSLDSIAFSLQPLVRAWANREEIAQWDEVLMATESSLKHRADQFLLDQSRLIVALHQEGQRLLDVSQCLHPSDRRRVYRTFCQQILERWIQGGPIPLGPLPTPELFAAWMRNKLFGLSLLRAPSIRAGALELVLRWSMLRTGLTLPLPFAPEGSPGDAENRRLVALEHGLRAERLWPVLARARRT